MNPVQHLSSNDVLLPPKGASRDECRPLYITRKNYVNPLKTDEVMPAVVSYWSPSKEELDLLNQGKPLYLSCVGTTHPPLFIGVDGDGNL